MSNGGWKLTESELESIRQIKYRIASEYKW